MRGTRARYVKSRRGTSGRMDWFERQEVEAAMRRGIAQGLSDPRVGEYAGVTGRAVWAYRKRHGIPPNR